MGPATILLDLNYTLCTNSDQRVQFFSNYKAWLGHELYREWLIEYCRDLQAGGNQVVMVTARPRKWEAATLARIEELHGWKPDAWHFKDSTEKAHTFKEHVLTERLFPENPHPGVYVGF